MTYNDKLPNYCKRKVRPALTTLFFITDENAPRADSRVANKVVRASALHLQRKPSAFSRRAPTLNSALCLNTKDHYARFKMNELRKLNFNELISVGVPDVTSYTFDEYKKNGYEHTPINGYCTSCEEKGCSSANDDDSYQLTNISHGAHSSDFFRALKVKANTTDWHKESIMFVYETPSLDYGIYKEVPYQKYKKHPSKDWYWIHCLFR